MTICPTCFQPLPPSTDVRVDLDSNCLFWKTACVQLTDMEAVIMSRLAEGGWVTLDRIMSDLYGAGDPAGDNIISVFFTKIRRKLRDHQVPIDIESFYKRGQHGSRGNRKYRLKYG